MRVFNEIRMSSIRKKQSRLIKEKPIQANVDPIFKWLNNQENQSFKGNIMWNFEKYFIDENGQLFKRFRSTTKPNSSSITSLI